MSTGSTFCGAAAMALMVAGCHGASPMALTGTVVDASGHPVHGARVARVPMGLFDPSGARYLHVETAADGSFRLPARAGRRYGVTATAPDGGMAPGATGAWASDVAAGAAGATELRLELGRGGRRLSGRVLDRGGRSCAGAEVFLARDLGENGDVFLAPGRADGAWSASVPEGDYYAHAICTPHGAGARAAPTMQAAVRSLPAGRDSVDLVLDPVGPPDPPPPAVIAWIQAHENPLSTVEAGHGFADLAPLRGIVGDARVVGLGEATHGTREIFQLKHRLLEYLVAEMGFTVFAIEFNAPESFDIDDYVLGGPGDPEALLAALSVAVWQTEELRDLVRWMREWNRTHPRKVHFHGLDMRKGDRAAKETLAYLARVDPSAAASPPARALAPMADPLTYRAIVRRPKSELEALSARARELLTRLEGQRDAYVAQSDAESWWRAAMQARVLAQALEWLAAGSSAARLRVRERAMAENALRVLEHHGQDARAVVSAHNAHIAGDAGAEPQMMGVHLRIRLGAAYRAFGSVLGGGSYQAIDPKTHALRDFTVPRAGAGSVENALTAAGAPLAFLPLLDLPHSGAVADWFGAFRALRLLDGFYDDDRPEEWGNPNTRVARDYDALLFTASGTTARKLLSASLSRPGGPSPPPARVIPR